MYTITTLTESQRSAEKPWGRYDIDAMHKSGGQATRIATGVLVIVNTPVLLGWQSVTCLGLAVPFVQIGRPSKVWKTHCKFEFLLLDLRQGCCSNALTDSLEMVICCVERNLWQFRKLLLQDLGSCFEHQVTTSTLAHTP